MRIINPSPDPKSETEVICWRCGAKLAYTQRDVRVVNRTDYTGSTDRYRLIDCPNCGGEITVQ